MSDEELEFSSLSLPEYQCEWFECNYKTGDIVDHQTHIMKHADRVIQSTTSSEPVLICSWVNCSHQPCNNVSQFKLHLSFHAFHSKIMSWGSLYMQSLSVREGHDVTCKQDSSGKHHLPVLPEYLLCLWKGCSSGEFDDLNAYFNHMEIHMNQKQDSSDDNPPIYKCLWKDCNATISHRSHFKRHLRSHTQEKGVSCPICGTMFSDSIKFIDHLMRQLTKSIATCQQEQQPNLVCHECSLQLATKRLFDEHSKKHSLSTKCPDCDYVARGKGTLAKHILYRHNTERKFSCTECSSSFKTVSDLNKHLAFHDEVAYRCISCNFEARSISVLNTHKKNAHGLTGDVYKCQLCQVEFQRAGSLTRHLSKQHVINLPKGRSRYKFEKQADGFVAAVIDWM